MYRTTITLKPCFTFYTSTDDPYVLACSQKGITISFTAILLLKIYITCTLYKSVHMYHVVQNSIVHMVIYFLQFIKTAVQSSILMFPPLSIDLNIMKSFQHAPSSSIPMTSTKSASIITSFPSSSLKQTPIHPTHFQSAKCFPLR